MNEKMKLVEDLLEKEAKFAEAYNLMDDAGNEVGKQAVRDAHKAHYEHLDELAKATKGFAFIYREVQRAKYLENDVIDINDVIHFITEEELMEAFKEFGIESFTFSSSWSSAVEAAWRFEKAGYKVSGMKMVHARKNYFGEEKYEEEPAYIFTLR